MVYKLYVLYFYILFQFPQFNCNLKLLAIPQKRKTPLSNPSAFLFDFFCLFMLFFVPSYWNLPFPFWIKVKWQYIDLTFLFHNQALLMSPQKFYISGTYIYHI